MVKPPVSAGTFAFRVDRARSLVFMDIAGLWDHATVDRWEDELAVFLPKERARDDDLRLLIDARDREIHSQDVALRVQNRAAWVAPHFTRVAVIVSTSALLTLQSRRIASVGGGADRQRFFAASDIAIAQDWLLEDQHRPGASPFRAKPQ